MSMPQYFSVTIISGRHPYGGEIAASVTAILRAGWKDEIQPKFVAVATHCQCRDALYEKFLAKGLGIAEAIPSDLIDPREFDLWLALDTEGEQRAKRRIETHGPAPRGFYRTIFSDPVIGCGFYIANPPANNEFSLWFESLTKAFAPWTQRFSAAFSESS